MLWLVANGLMIGDLVVLELLQVGLAVDEVLSSGVGLRVEL